MKRAVTVLFFTYLVVNLFSQSQMQIKELAYQDYQKADKELNEVYQKILEKYKENTVFIEKLRATQLIWIQFRDAELEMKYPHPDKNLYYGSMYFVCTSEYLRELTEERTKKLKEWLGVPDEYEPCNGSVGAYSSY